MNGLNVSSIGADCAEKEWMKIVGHSTIRLCKHYGIRTPILILAMQEFGKACKDSDLCGEDWTLFCEVSHGLSS